MSRIGLNRRVGAALQALRGKGAAFSPAGTWTKLASTIGGRLARGIGRTDFERQIGEFKSHVAACTSLIAEKSPVVPLKLYVDDASSPTGRTEIVDHPFLDMWWNVNSYSNHHEFIELIITYLCLTGNAYLYLVPNALGVPAEIHLLPSQNVRIVPDREKIIGGYRYKMGGSFAEFTPEEIVHFRLPNPYDPFFYGLSLVCKAAVAIADQANIDVFQDALFKNLATPGVGIITNGRLDDKVFNRIKEQFDEEFSGVDRAGKPIILEDVKDIKTWENAINLRDYSFLKGRLNIKEEIYSIWKVPLTYGSREATPSRATLENDQLRLAVDCIAPMLSRIQEKLNERVMPIYDPELYCEFDISVIVPPDREFRLKEIESHINSGYSTPDEERAKDGKDPRPDGGGDKGKQINPPSVADLLGSGDEEAGAGEEEGKSAHLRLAEEIEQKVKSAVRAELLGAAPEGKAKKIGPGSSAKVEKKIDPQRASMRRKTAREFKSLSGRAVELAGE